MAGPLRSAQGALELIAEALAKARAQKAAPSLSKHDVLRSLNVPDERSFLSLAGMEEPAYRTAAEHISTSPLAQLLRDQKWGLRADTGRPGRISHYDLTGGTQLPWLPTMWSAEGLPAELKAMHFLDLNSLPTGGRILGYDRFAGEEPGAQVALPKGAAWLAYRNEIEGLSPYQRPSAPPEPQLWHLLSEYENRPPPGASWRDTPEHSAMYDAASKQYNVQLRQHKTVVKSLMPEAPSWQDLLGGGPRQMLDLNMSLAVPRNRVQPSISAYAQGGLV
jgi:hypothetical protein